MSLFSRLISEGPCDLPQPVQTDIIVTRTQFVVKGSTVACAAVKRMTTSRNTTHSVVFAVPCEVGK